MVGKTPSLVNTRPGAATAAWLGFEYFPSPPV
jgi:hypothetical protein